MATAVQALVKKNSGIVQFVKFGIVGVSNTAVDWIVFYLLISYALPDLRSLAKAIAFIVAVLNSYIWNTLWTFRKEYKKVGADTAGKSAVFGKFIVVSLIGWGVNVLVYSWAAKSLTLEILNQDFLPLVLASGAAIVWNFSANKLWTYKK